MRTIFHFCALIGLLMTGSASRGDSVAEEARSIHELAWLVGNWTYEDRSVDGSYVETGTRTCSFVLANSHIRCLSVGKTNKGKERSYLFYFSYNHSDKRFEIAGLTSDFPRKNLYAVTVSDDGHKLDLSNNWWEEGGLVPTNIATITYDGSELYVWEIRSGEIDEATGLPPIKFRDTVWRVAEDSS